MISAAEVGKNGGDLSEGKERISTGLRSEAALELFIQVFVQVSYEENVVVLRYSRSMQTDVLMTRSDLGSE